MSTREGGWRARTHWGVILVGGDRVPGGGRVQDMLLGEAWMVPIVALCEFAAAHPHCPTRPLLFVTRRAARAYCAGEHAKYAGRSDSCARWRFRPVRVRESYRVLA